MKRYVVKIRYTGTAFHGFQAQPVLRTVQGEMTRIAQTAFRTPCRVTGCSRTDSGVHAEEYFLLLEIGDAADTPPPDRLLYVLEPYLPEDISVLCSCLAPEGFHPRYSVAEKEYCYRIWNAARRDPLRAHRVFHYPRPISEAALCEMNRAAALLSGRQDFRAFMAEGGNTEKSTIRTVSRFFCRRLGDIVEVNIRADGFLYNMVRILTGTLLEVAAGRMCADDMPDILASGNRCRAGMTVPPDGLYLHRVFFPAGFLPDFMTSPAFSEP